MKNLFRMLQKVKELIVVNLMSLKGQVKALNLRALLKTLTKWEHFFHNLVQKSILWFQKLVFFSQAKT